MAPGGARTAEILDTAADCVATSGVHVSIHAIAQACGLRTSSLYHHFESKDALLAALVDRYLAELDRIAAATHEQLAATDPDDVLADVVSFCTALGAASVHHRAALLLTMCGVPGSADASPSDKPTPPAVEVVMGELLVRARTAHLVRDDVDLGMLGDLMSQAMLHVGLGLFPDPEDAPAIAPLRCLTLLHGVAVDPPTFVECERSDAMSVARLTIASWKDEADTSDERTMLLQAVARAEFVRRGYRATTIRDIVAAVGMHGTDVFRRFGSKERLVATITDVFSAKITTGWNAVMASSSDPVEKLAALITLDLHLCTTHRDEYRVLQAWLRESPPSSRTAWSYPARLRDLERLVRAGTRAGTMRVPGPNVAVRARALADLLWLPDSVLDAAGDVARATDFLVDVTLRGASAVRPAQIAAIATG